MLVLCAKILKCDPSLLKKSINDVSSVTDKEKIFTFNSYYRFLNNPNCVNFLENAKNELDKHLTLDDEDLMHLITIVLKSFLDKKTVSSVDED